MGSFVNWVTKVSTQILNASTLILTDVYEIKRHKKNKMVRKPFLMTRGSETIHVDDFGTIWDIVG